MFRRYDFPLTLAVLCGAAVLAPPACIGQQPGFTQVNPRELGLDIPPGPMFEGGNVCVTTNDAQGQSVVAKVWVQVGEHRVVLLPDGELVARGPDQITPTDRRFDALTNDELIKRFSAGAFAGATIRKTRHYVYVYNTTEEFSFAVSRTLETMIPGMTNTAKQFRIDSYEPQVPLVAIMFRTRKQFDSFRKMPPGVMAYYHTLTNQIVMYEESPLWKSDPDLALQQSITTIAHEGAHQILHNIGVQQRLSQWPMWLSEGLAEYFAPTSFGKNMRWKGPGQVNDLRMFELESYLKGRNADSPHGQLVEHTVAAALTSTGYAAAWSLTHFLARSQRERFHNFVRTMSKMRPLEACGEIIEPGIVPQNLVTFRQHFGEDLTAQEERLIKHLKSLPYTDPFSDWPHYVAMVEVPEKKGPNREANLFQTPELARKWASDIIAALPEPQRSLARQSVEKFPNRTAAERYARQFQGR